MEERFTLDHAKNVIFRYLSYRARSEEEVKRHLSRKGFSEAVVETALEWAREYRLLDDSEFAARWVENRRLLKPMGKRRIAYELREKGIPEAIVDSNLAGFSAEEEYRLACSLVEGRLNRATRPVAPEKLISWLLRRGFPLQLCYQVVRELANNPHWAGKLLNS
ncbi:MAG: regulatory protein RecX [Clostridia bacterium]|nr:regulatory protein RecX [Clostridia bacterium]